jgi:hypothetical protein
MQFTRILLYLEPVAKAGYFCTGSAVSQAKACGLKSDETCVFKKLLLQNCSRNEVSSEFCNSLFILRKSESAGGVAGAKSGTF